MELVLLHLLAAALTGAVTLLYLFLRRRYSYWADRGIVHEKPVLMFGNMRDTGRTKPFREPFYELYMKYKHEAPFGGFYLFLRRAAVVFDLDLIKQVLIKDFSNFSTRANYYNEKDDPLSAHLFNLEGEKWRNLRNKLSPTFTSGKMKFMFTTVVDVAERFLVVLKELLTEVDRDQNAMADGIEFKELLARFTTDVIGSCAFGLECNSLKDPQTKFRLMGKKAFEVLPQRLWLIAVVQAFPNLCRKLHVKTIPGDVSAFFMQVVRETVEYREQNNVQRNDFMSLLLGMKQNNEMEGLTLEQITAQAFLFFLAGFETSSSSMSFALYELAVNQDIQNRARKEINEVLQRQEGKLTYEGLYEMKYLQQILKETMRKYSIAPAILRKTLSDYSVENGKYTIEKDIVVVIPVDAIHRDPDIYPNPEKFDPQRFSPEEVEKRHPMSWLPFGDGPRNCVAQRFGEMQALVGLAMLLKNFRFSPSKLTPIPLTIDKKSFILASEGGIHFKVEAISSN